MAYGDELSFILRDVRLVKVFGPLYYLGCPTIQDGQERACEKEVEPDISGVFFCDRCQKEVSPIPVAKISRGRFEDCDGNVIKITVFGEDAERLLKMTGYQAQVLDNQCSRAGDTKRACEQRAVQHIHSSSWVVSLDFKMLEYEGGKYCSATAWSVRPTAPEDSKKQHGA
jgi:hypothetical protein